MKPRLKFLNVLRVLSFCLVIYYHMLIHTGTMGWLSFEKLNLLYSTANMHVATLAVSLFFMISGAGLMLSAKDHFELKSYYKKRMTRILIPFYLVYAGYLFLQVVYKRGINGVFYHANLPKWRFLFTLAGMDEWVNMHGYPTFTLGIGEWFLGCLVILYLIFPVLRYFMIKNKYATIVAATVYDLVVIFNYNSEVVPVYMSILIKAYEFILGMFLILFLDKLNKKWLFITIPLIFFWTFYPKVLPVNKALGITLYSTLFFITFSQLETVFQKHDLKWIEIACTYSYELFLVHHITIYQCSNLIAPYMNAKWKIPVLFAAEIVCMVILAILLHIVVHFIHKILKV